MVQVLQAQMPLAQQNRLIRQDRLWRQALRIHYDAILVDGHTDTPIYMQTIPEYDFGKRKSWSGSHTDLPRMFEGGLDAPFWAIYVGPEYPEGRDAQNQAKDLIALVNRQLGRFSDQIALATTVQQVRDLHQQGKKAVLLGIEGGHALGGDSTMVQKFYDLGVRYIGLTHTNTNLFADSGQGEAQWGGLNDLGVAIVRQMNRLGILVDVSHASDDTVRDVLEVSTKPIIASHSSARALTASRRNLPDDLIRKIAENGGVVMVNFAENLVNPRFDAAFDAEVDRRIQSEYQGNYRQYWRVVNEIQIQRQIPPARISNILQHIDYLVRLVGIDHVGLGSDFEGAKLASDMTDCTKLPWITYGLLKKGYSEQDIRKILGENVLRVLVENGN